MDFRELFNQLDEIANDHEPQIGDIVGIELGDTLLETYIEDITEDGVIVKVDETALSMMIDAKKALIEGTNHINEELGYSDVSPETASIILRKMEQGMPMSDIVDEFPELSRKMEIIAGEQGLHLDDDFEDIEAALYNELEDIAAEGGDFGDEEMKEAEYQGRKVPLGKPMKGDVKKSKVYVKGPKGNVVKVNFGDKNMRIKKSIPGRRKSFRARHNCDNPGPRWKARYWSCRAW